MNWDEFRKIWRLPEPYAVRPISQGFNNLTQAIDTPAGSYASRRYNPDRPLERVRYELSVCCLSPFDSVSRQAYSSDSVVMRAGLKRQKAFCNAFKKP